jgi:D-xylose 1-dehydrogenase (NADP+, D-xylono-1,5-lactone-forming)
VSATVKWGFLSTAKINGLVLAGARQSDRVDTVAVASRDERRARQYAGANGFERAYGSYEALLEDPDVEAVYISVPNSLHVEWSIRALEAGKHVLCEKPFDRRPEAVERAFDAAERANRLLMEAFMFRFNPQTARLKELLAEGAIGTPRVIRAAFSFTLSNPENVRLAADLDGGALMDVGCYCVSGSRLVAGEPEAVFGEQVVGPSGVDLRFVGTLRFPGDVISHFDCGFDLPGRDELEVIGSDGALFLDDPWHCRVPGIEVRAGGKTETIALDPVDSYRLELENLGDAIRGHAEPVLDRADSVGQARAIEALYRSAGEGRVVTLS